MGTVLFLRSSVHVLFCIAVGAFSALAMLQVVYAAGESKVRVAAVYISG